MEITERRKEINPLLLSIVELVPPSAPSAGTKVASDTDASIALSTPHLLMKVSGARETLAAIHYFSVSDAVRSLVFVFVLVLLLSSVAQAKIEVRGDKAFQEQASQALEDIKRTTPEGWSLVTALETSKYTHVIRRAAAVDWNAPHSLNEASNGIGTGSTTRWNPNSKKPYADGVNRDPIAALFHELCHALEAERGAWGGSLDPATGIRKSEIHAIRTENAYRRAKGLPERTKYGQQDLPQIEAEMLAETSPNEPHSDGPICREDVDSCAADAVVLDAGAGETGCEEGDRLNAP